jgi:hypothetical protein
MMIFAVMFGVLLVTFAAVMLYLAIKHREI